MATGGTDHMIRVYYLGAESPMKVSEMDAHTVRNSIQSLHSSWSALLCFLRFVYTTCIFSYFLCF